MQIQNPSFVLLLCQGKLQSLCRISPLVVESELCAGGYVGLREYADARVAVDGPLLRLAVGLARVVHEARDVPLRPRVDDPLAVHHQVVKVRLQLQRFSRNVDQYC